MSRNVICLVVVASFSLLAIRADEFRSAPELRESFFKIARPAISNLLTETERNIGMRIAFMALPTNDAVAARFIYDTHSNEPQIQLRAGWDDGEVAHELMHTRMDLMDQLPMLAWRRGVERTPEIEAAFGRIQTYVKDELVHANLTKLGLRPDGEILRPSLFDSIYTHAARHLEAGRDRPNDGMAHLDKIGRGTVCRVCFFVQAELILKSYRTQLPPKRIEQTERFILAFRQHRPEETATAEKVLALFAKHDVSTAEGQREILVGWITLEGLEKYVGPSSYRKTDDGRYILPFPTDT